MKNFGLHLINNDRHDSIDASDGTEGDKRRNKTPNWIEGAVRQHFGLSWMHLEVNHFRYF